MKTANAGSMVKQGYWFNVNGWTLLPVEKDGDLLPGRMGERYVYVPLPAAFLVAPILGLTFLMFLPVIGFALTAQAALRPVTKLFGRSAVDMAATVAPGWQPGEAHLTGQRPEGDAKDAAAANGELAKLEGDIAAKRKE
jgi:hypothetical protein